ncbi:DUF983 domain-containing protein [Pararhizobium mangrovi]|uniref:DUF983 domain-containing protein n=1 Tax=Pararhizobium mangrovi TaxID=2590452 RepID=A0A506U5S3_9HYPH|nr:DUF983 domain-containing protein [Pararhizobium mangrovi]TPW28706.1 DUF983 domain-containing protein [Pararhizobium mangrovi]
MTHDETSYLPADAIRAGLSGRCPRCGKGALFDGFVAPRVRCERCGLDYGFADAGDGPAVFVIMAIGFFVVGLALWSEVRFAPPLWLHFVLWIPLAAVLCLAALRPFKGVMIALQYRNSARQGEIDSR